jgi:hypothetical protein
MLLLNPLSRAAPSPRKKTILDIWSSFGVAAAAGQIEQEPMSRLAAAAVSIFPDLFLRP